MAPLLAVLSAGALCAASPSAAQVPTVAIVTSSFRDGSYMYRDEYDGALEQLAWPVEKFGNTQIAELADRLDEFDLLIGTAVFNYEHPQDFGAHAEALTRFVRYGGVLLLTDVNYAPQVSWLPELEPGLRIAVAGERCSSDGSPASWTDVRHPLLAGVKRIPCVWTHPTAVSGLWHVLARCDEGRPILMYRELGDGVVVASHIYRQYGFPDVTFLQNLWRWARDERRIAAARAREEARYQALHEPRELEARRIDPPPVIDGMLADEAWSDSARTPQFVKTDNSSVAEQSTTARIGFDDYYLYVAFDCQDTDPAAIAMQATERDGAVYHDDCVELFVDPTGKRESYRHFIVNAAGTVYDEATIDPSWDGWWQAAVQRHPRGWTAELCIPLVALGEVRNSAEEWAVNFNRHYPRTGELSGWSPTFGAFAAPSHFGVLKKVAVDPRRFPLRPNRIEFSDGKLAVSLGNYSDDAFAGRYVVESLSASGRQKQTVREVSIAGRGSTLIETEHLMEEPGIHTLWPRVEADGGPVWIAQPIRHEVAPWLTIDLPNQAYRGAIFGSQPWAKEVQVVAHVRQVREGMAVEVDVAGEGLAERRREAVPESGAVTVTFPAAEWGPGEYGLTVRLLHADTELERVERALHVYPPSPGTEVVLDDEGICYVGGEPFLPLGLYHVSEPVANLVSQQNEGMGLPPLTLEAMLDDVRSKGFNCFVRGWGMPSREFMDLAHERGLRVMPEIGGWPEDKILEAVRLGRDHPALLMWYSVDEPAGDRLKHSLAVRDVFLREDPHHPVGAALNNPALFAKAAGALDVLMPDPYPIERVPISMVSIHADQAEQARTPGQALWVVPQAFAVHNRWREPTPEELRNMTYQAIVSGARGLVWYAYYTTESHEDFGMPRNPKRKQWWYPETPLWEYHGKLNAELAGLQDAILAPGGARLQTSNEAVRALHRKAPERHVAFAINVERESHEVKVSVPEGTPDGKATVLGEDRGVRIEDGSLTDIFEPLAVHVYSY
jgi:hypothetical protein